MATTHGATAAELWLKPPTGRWELVRVEVRMMNAAGYEHGDIAMEIGARLRVFATQRKLGTVVAAETGFLIERDPDTVRAADVAFVRRQREPKSRLAGFFPGAPDLAVEVVSPSDRANDVQEKVALWLRRGCSAVCVVDPRGKTAAIARMEDGVVVSAAVDTLRDDSPLHGFTLEVAELFDAP